MTFDEKILAYDMTERDKLLAEVAQVIVGAYNGSYKPHLIPKERETAPPYYKWIHSIEGYSLISSDTECFEKASVLTTDESISEFVEHLFLVLAGNPSVKWDDVCKSDTVNRAIVKYLEMPNITFSKIELSDVGYNEYFDDHKQLKPSIRHTIRATVDLKVSENAWQAMESKGFTYYFDRNFWEMRL